MDKYKIELTKSGKYAVLTRDYFWQRWKAVADPAPTIQDALRLVGSAWWKEFHVKVTQLYCDEGVAFDEFKTVRERFKFEMGKDGKWSIYTRFYCLGRWYPMGKYEGLSKTGAYHARAINEALSVTCSEMWKKFYVRVDSIGVF